MGRIGCGIVQRLVVAHRTIICRSVPFLGECQRLRNIAAITTTSVVALVAYVVNQHHPFRIVWYMPAYGTNTTTTPHESHGKCIVVTVIHTSLSIRGVEGVHRRVPIVEQAVVHRRVHGRVVVIPAGLLSSVGGACSRSRDKVGSRTRRSGCAQVVAHPALAANLHRGIHVALVVGDRGGGRTGFFIHNGNARIAEAADGKTVVLVTAVAVHSGKSTETAIICLYITALSSTPKIGTKSEKIAIFCVASYG